MAKKCVVIYVEGETDEEFYNKVKEHIRNKIPSKRFDVDALKVECVKGIGNFSTKLLNKFKKEILIKYKDYRISVFLCYDHDVFEYSVNPPVDRDKLEKNLLEAGANEVKHIVAYRSIEDYLMIDTEGILKFLRLKDNTKINGKNGLEKITNLFKKANRTYIKGTKVEGLVDSLDIEKICNHICSQLCSLCKEVGLECDKQKES